MSKISVKNFYDPVTNREMRKDLSHYLHRFIISPEQWKTLKVEYKKLNWVSVKFSKAYKGKLTDTEGIYMFVASPGSIKGDFINYLLYVGETGNINQRFKNYLDKLDKPKSQQYHLYTILDDFADNLNFYYSELAGYDEKKRKTIEDDFLMSFMPPFNSIYPQHIQKLVLSTYRK